MSKCPGFCPHPLLRTLNSNSLVQLSLTITRPFFALSHSLDESINTHGKLNSASGGVISSPRELVSPSVKVGLKGRERWSESAEYTIWIVIPGFVNIITYAGLSILLLCRFVKIRVFEKAKVTAHLFRQCSLQSH